MADEDDPEIDEKFTKAFNKLFHAGMAERDKRTAKQMQKLVEDGVGNAIKGLTEQLPELLKSHLPPPPEQPKQQPGQLSPELEARFAKTDKELKEARAAAEKWKTAAEEQQRARDRSEEQQLLQQHLTGKVKPVLLPVAVAQLHGTNIVRDKESGKVVWRDDDGEFLPLADGVEKWAKSELGKEFAPPVSAGGSGSRGGSGNNNTGRSGKIENSEQLADILFPGKL